MVLKRVSVKRNPPDSVERALETLWKYLSPRQRHQLELWVLRHFALIFLLLLAVPRARAQFVGFVSPQSDQELAFNAVSCGAATFTPHNLGQTMHFLSYTTSGSIVNLDLRLEASNDGTTFFPISDEATDSPSGLVYAVGYFPVVRARIVTCVGTGTITASYVGTSSSATPPLGTYNSAQVVRKVIFTGASEGSSATAILSTPFGSTLGYIFVTQVSGAGTFPAGSSISNVAPSIANQSSSMAATISPSTGLGGLSVGMFVVSAAPTVQVIVSYTSGGASTNTFSAYYVFVSPATPSGISSSQAQPLTTFNSQSTGVAATVSTTIGASSGQRVLLFSVSARCSAGTAGLTVSDGATAIWSTGSAEVGTSTFRFQWFPGLASTTGNLMQVTLTSCGAGNTGTLDVQASQQ